MMFIISRYKDRPEPEIQDAYKYALANIDIAKAEFAVESGRHLASLRHYLAAMKTRQDKRTLWAAGSALKNGLTGAGAKKSA